MDETLAILELAAFKTRYDACAELLGVSPMEIENATENDASVARDVQSQDDEALARRLAGQR